MVPNGLGGFILAKIAELAMDCERHPERGRFLDHVEALAEDRRRQKASAEKEHQVVAKRLARNDVVSSYRLTHNEYTEGGMPLLEGSVGFVSSENNTIIIKCRGYFISFFPEDDSQAVIVLQLLDSQGL